MKKTIFIFTALLITTLIFNSCNELKKMAKNVGSVERTITPNPLEMHNGKVPIDISIKFPPKYFGKHVKLVLTPQLASVSGNDSIDFKSQTLIGEKFEDQGTSISYKEGGSFSFKDTVDYKDIYRMSSLKLKLQASTTKGKSADIIDFPLAKGIITTPLLVDAGMLVDAGKKDGETPIGDLVTVGGDGTNRIGKPEIKQETLEGKLYFTLQSASVKRDKESKKQIDSLVSFIKAANDNPDLVLEGIKIFSYASPDGPLDLNEGLVGKRGTATESLLKKALKKAKVEKDGDFYVKEVTAAEDWAGFEEAVKNSSIDDKDLILRVISMYTDPTEREREIKKIAAAYNKLRNNVLPLLRRSVVKLVFKGKAKTDAEFVNLGVSDPSKLQQDELLYAATIATDLNKQETIYKNFTTTYSDWRAWNNLAVTQVKLGKLSDAKVNFQKVLDVKSNNPAAFNNLGVIYMAEGDMNSAWDYFEKAEEAGCTAPALGYNMGVILIKKGKYDDAVTKITNDSFNKALAQTLAGDNNSAIATLNSLGTKDNAMFYYLKAVVAAKDNSEDLYEYLGQAVAKDSKLKAYAASDMEFRKFFDKADFKDIVK